MQGQTGGQGGSETECKRNEGLRRPEVGAEVPLLVQPLPGDSHLCVDWEIWAEKRPP